MLVLCLHFLSSKGSDFDPRGTGGVICSLSHSGSYRKCHESQRSLVSMDKYGLLARGIVKDDEIDATAMGQ